MAYRWPADTVFRALTLEVEDRTCWQCQHLPTAYCHRLAIPLSVGAVERYVGR
jgi:predicted metal-binding protein